MTIPTLRPPGRPSRLRGRLTLAIGAAAAITVAGLPGLHIGQAEAAAKPQRCDEKYLGHSYGTTPPNSGPPLNGDYDPYPTDENYTYVNPARDFDGVLAPTQAQLDKAGTDYRSWQKKFEKTGDPEYRVMEMYARYQRQYNSPTGYKEWNRWMDIRWLAPHGSPPRGDAFMARMVKKYNMVGPDWWCEDTLQYTDEDGKPQKRYVDARNRAESRNVEIKSNGHVEDDQMKADRQLAKQRPNDKFQYLTGAATDDPSKKKIKAFDEELKKARGTNEPQAGIVERRSNAIERPQKPNVYTKYDPRFNADPLRGGRSPIMDEALRSGKTPEEAFRIQKQYQASNRGGYFMRGPGGIDFSTMQLNYVSTPVKGQGMKYSLKADYAKDPDTKPGYGGEARLNLADDAFFTWLALTPDKFWVNLNPIRPDLILDSEFAKTDAGRILLEADLTLKHDYADAMNPDKYERGERFWQAAPRTAEGQPCLPIIRQWITPKPATVREQDGGIYILDAPLKVNMEVPTGPDVPPNTCKIDEAQTRQAETLIKTVIQPELERRVNNDPSYADLRYVYRSRVAAEHVRRADATQPTDFHKIINSNDISKWKLRAPNQNWDKKTVYDKYVYSFKNGDYKFKRTYGGKVWILSMGGVDFSKAPKRNITHAQFNAQHQDLDKTTKTSTQAETTYRNTEQVFLGADGERGGSGGDPTPTPTPTDTGKPTPTHSPSTPAPTPSTPAGGHSQPPATKNPDGDLAHTGNNIPVGLIAGIAAALAATGAALTWWMRRRKQGPAS
ncbi:hypothetical protein GCM10010211_47320 [Streptomyces albospinus]|uniref:Uncharacterized protein n=1 Tax=Streptomyces albospinus TaxID=285515 RepID=A0ABQ2V9V5_9ACTN|nr:hypothetical protein [Streptomyces albospinus]GGU75906.1 hypothetical protein GCM10010211_47320 [Streptomyces albospinus]